MINDTCLQLLPSTGFTVSPYKHIRLLYAPQTNSLRCLVYSIVLHSILSQSFKKKLYLLILLVPQFILHPSAI